MSERISAVTKGSKHLGEGKTSTPPVDWLGGFLSGIGRRLHADADAQAQGYGWQITQRNGGLSRRYRDPRFDTLARCPSCGGKGDVDEAPCEPCGGTGRVTVRQRSLVPRGAGDA
jgi:hypothetical protein